MSELRQIGPWRVRTSREVYRNRWLRVREDNTLDPNGDPSRYAIVQCRPAVGIVAVTDDRQIHLVGQHRYAVDEYSWEVPAGGVDDGEDLLDAAKRVARGERALGRELAVAGRDASGEQHPRRHLSPVPGRGIDAGREESGSDRATR